MPKHSKAKNSMTKVPLNNKPKVRKPMSASELDVQNSVKSILKGQGRPLVGQYSGKGRYLLGALAAGMVFAPMAAALGVINQQIDASNQNPGNAGNSGPGAAGTLNNDSMGLSSNVTATQTNGSVSRTLDSIGSAGNQVNQPKGQELPHVQSADAPKPKSKKFTKPATKNKTPEQPKASANAKVGIVHPKFRRRVQQTQQTKQADPVRLAEDQAKRRAYQEQQRKQKEASQKLIERQEKLRKEKQALFNARVTEIENTFIPEIIKAFGGAQVMAQYPVYANTNPAESGYNIPFDAVKDKVTFSMTKSPLMDGSEYRQHFVTLRYEVTGPEFADYIATGREEKYIAIETFGNRGYSGGVYRMVDGKPKREIECICHLRFTPRDTNYLNDLLAGNTVQRRFGSWGVSKKDIASGKIRMWNKKEEQEKQECLSTVQPTNPGEEEWCYFNGNYQGDRIRLSDEPVVRNAPAENVAANHSVQPPRSSEAPRLVATSSVEELPRSSEAPRPNPTNMR